MEFRKAGENKEDLIPHVIQLMDTKPAGALAKLQVVAGLFGTSRGRRSDEVRTVAEDLARVLGSLPTTGNGGPT